MYIGRILPISRTTAPSRQAAVGPNNRTGAHTALITFSLNLHFFFDLRVRCCCNTAILWIFSLYNVPKHQLQSFDISTKLEAALYSFIYSDICVYVGMCVFVSQSEVVGCCGGRPRRF